MEKKTIILISIIFLIILIIGGIASYYYIQHRKIAEIKEKIENAKKIAEEAFQTLQSGSQKFEKSKIN